MTRVIVSSTPHRARRAREERSAAGNLPRARNEYTLAGSIYKGRVTRVLPGMQSLRRHRPQRDASSTFPTLWSWKEHDEDLPTSAREPQRAGYAGMPQTAEPRMG